MRSQEMTSVVDDLDKVEVWRIVGQELALEKTYSISVR